MNECRSNTNAKTLAARLLDARRVMVTTHSKPDGDAMGSTLALVRALHAKGKAADLFLMGPVESNLKTIASPTPYRLVEQSAPADDYDVIAVLDTGAWSQLEPLAAYLRKHHERVIGIDHHTRGDEVAAVRLIEPKAVSATAVLLPVLEAMGVELTGEAGGIAEALFVGLATDSGWFRYGNAGAEAFETASRLLARGVDKSRLYQILEETHPPQRLALEARALASLEYRRNGSFAIQTLRIGDFTATGGSPEDLTGLVNTPMTVGMVRVSVLISQSQPGITKISFRSKPAPPDAPSNQFIDVNALAAKFGGGGHIHAAGARIGADIDAASTQVLAAIDSF